MSSQLRQLFAVSLFFSAYVFVSRASRWKALQRLRASTSRSIPFHCFITGRDRFTCFIVMSLPICTSSTRYTFVKASFPSQLWKTLKSVPEVLECQQSVKYRQEEGAVLSVAVSQIKGPSHPAAQRQSHPQEGRCRLDPSDGFLVSSAALPRHGERASLARQLSLLVTNQLAPSSRLPSPQPETLSSSTGSARSSTAGTGVLGKEERLQAAAASWREFWHTVGFPYSHTERHYYSRPRTPRYSSKKPSFSSIDTGTGLSMSMSWHHV
jgi:hypothetical protein